MKDWTNNQLMLTVKVIILIGDNRTSINDDMLLLVVLVGSFNSLPTGVPITVNDVLILCCLVDEADVEEDDDNDDTDAVISDLVMSSNCFDIVEG